MKAGFIKMHKITERQELKIVPNKEYTVEFVGKRIYDCYAEVVINGKNSCVNDIELGVIAKVLDIKRDEGSDLQVEIANYLKPSYEVEDFYKDDLLTQKNLK